MNNKDITGRLKDWLFFAEEDLKLAQISFNGGIYHGTCFHAQQTAEKAIKAYLLSNGQRVPKIHSLTGLLDLNDEIKRDFKEFSEEIEFLDQFYIPTRYPDAFPGSLPEGLPNKNDGEKALESAGKILNFVKKNFSI
ncbi:HEPN domain-containing protein [Candidatus Roizmanbacteria bacterium]|nr:HEPN domain-containing protein [Candidatus Roizmanbacteria bacterium]